MKQQLRTTAGRYRQRCWSLWRRLRRPTVVRHMGVRLRVGEQVTPAVRRSLFNGSYERGEARAVRRWLADDDVVVELGAGLGFIAILCAQRLGGDRVHTFEANPLLESTVRENFRLNGVEPALHMVMLDREAGSRPFFLDADFWTSSNRADGRDRARTIDVPTRSFNETMAALQPTFLIIDIEGGEADLLTYAQLDSVRTVCIEIHDDVLGAAAAQRVRDRIAELGFELKWHDGSEQYLYQRVRAAADDAPVRSPATAPALAASAVDDDEGGWRA